MEQEFKTSDVPEKEFIEKHAENISQPEVTLNDNETNKELKDLNGEYVDIYGDLDENMEQKFDTNDNQVEKQTTDENQPEKSSVNNNSDFVESVNENKIENVETSKENSGEAINTNQNIENSTVNNENMDVTNENDNNVMVNSNSSINDAISTLKTSVETIKTDFMSIVNAFKATTESSSASFLDKANSLKQLLDYGSTSPEDSSESDSDETDSESDSADNSCQVVIPTIAKQTARIKNDASDTESSSSSSSEDYDSFDSGPDSDESIKIVKTDVAKKPAAKKEPRIKGEIRMCDLPPIENLHITVPEENCVELGVVSAIVEELVVIQSLPTMPALDVETVLFLNKGQETLGKIFDVFGPVNNPCYSVRFNNNEEIVGKKIEVGTTVYCAPSTEHTSYVVIPDLMKVKGSDASWREDSEPPIHLLEFSDDEEERRVRAKLKNKQRATDSNSKRLTEFERRKNERNLYLNEHFKKNSPNYRNRHNPDSNWAYNHNKSQSQNNQWWHRSRLPWMNPLQMPHFASPYTSQPNPFFNNGNAATFSQNSSTVPQQPAVTFPFYPIAPGAVPKQPDFPGAVVPPLLSFQQPPPPPPPPGNSSPPPEADV